MSAPYVLYGVTDVTMSEVSDTSHSEKHAKTGEASSITGNKTVQSPDLGEDCYGGELSRTFCDSIPAELRGVISAYSARVHRILPVARRGDTIVLLTDKTPTPHLEQLLTFYLGRPIEVVEPEGFPFHRAQFHALLNEYCAQPDFLHSTPFSGGTILVTPEGGTGGCACDHSE